MKAKIKGGYVLISDEDSDILRQYDWYVGGGYAIARKKINGKYVTLRMHRLINNTPKGKDTDHINRNKLDNRRGNLRIVSRSTNCQNSRKRKVASSKFIGVSYESSRDKWLVRITKDEKTFFCGRFKCEKEAALAYNAAALRLYGENAAINHF